MATFTKQLLSGSTQGKSVEITQTATPGTVIHQTGTSSSVIDEVYLYCVNPSTSSIKLTVEWGGTTDPDNLIEVTVPPEEGAFLISPGFPVTGDGTTALTIRAFAGTANQLQVYGWVNRIT